MKSKNTPQQFRQGDVFIERVDTIPADLKAKPRQKGSLVLANGEATGHMHAIKAKHAKAYQGDLGVTFLDIAEALAEVHHEEHSTVVLPPGKYRVIRQREYSPASIRNVAD